MEYLTKSKGKLISLVAMKIEALETRGMMKMSIVRPYSFKICTHLKNTCLLLVVGLGLTACIMITDAWRNDMSQMGSDYFSTLIKDAGPESRGKKGPYGFYGINQEQVKSNARDFILNKTEPEIRLLFSQNGDRCLPLSMHIENRYFVCEATRSWKLKHMRFLLPDTDTPPLPRPGVKLMFKFFLTPNKQVEKSEIEIVDLTQNKIIY